MQIIIEDKIVHKMYRHAEETYPNECCGFFFGTDDPKRKVTHAYEVKNVKEGDQRRRFEISPNDYRKAERFAHENGLDFLGVYHSHPDHPAEPSEHDRKVAMPYFSYVIISVKDGTAATLRSWQLNKKRQFSEEEFVLNKVSTQT